MLSLTRLSAGLNINLELCRRQTIFVKGTNNQGIIPNAAKHLLVIWSGFRPAPIFVRMVISDSTTYHLFLMFSQRY